MSRYIALGILLVFLLIPLNQAFAQQFDPLEKLNNSTILVEGRALLFSNNDIEIRQFTNSHIVKIQGQATTGEILIVFLKDNNPNFQKVMAAYDGQIHKGSLIPKIPSIESKVVETEEPSYIPDLMMTSSHDSITYWKDTFNIDVQAFDGKINSDPKSSDFNGRIDGVDVKVILSLDDVIVVTLSGVTANNGHWSGEYFIQENISDSGEYVVDMILTYHGETISKSSTMIVIGDIIKDRTNTP